MMKDEIGRMKGINPRGSSAMPGVRREGCFFPKIPRW
jgi:hypothetical protein